MNKWIENLKEFHKSFGLQDLPKPGLCSWELSQLRQRLIKEEIDEIEDADGNDDIVGIADGIVDSIYVLIGTALTYGLGDKLDAMFAEVHRSNMSKLGKYNTPILREDGKILKGPNFSKPDLKSILES